MKFPDFEVWKSTVVNPVEEKFMGKQAKYQYYVEKFELAGKIMVESPTIGEVGVRYGYSAASFLFAHPTATYFGWDCINAGHGGIKGGVDTFVYVKEMLSRNFPDVVFTLTHEDSTRMNSFGDVKFDIFHVDGNHKCEPCLHDMRMAFAAMNPGGMMIVDDYTYIGSVKKAVDMFIEENRKIIGKVELIESGFRGNALIFK